jgi:hypothetical protein
MKYPGSKLAILAGSIAATLALWAWIAWPVWHPAAEEQAAVAELPTADVPPPAAPTSAPAPAAGPEVLVRRIVYLPVVRESESAPVDAPVEGGSAPPIEPPAPMAEAEPGAAPAPAPAPAPAAPPPQPVAPPAPPVAPPPAPPSTPVHSGGS